MIDQKPKHIKDDGVDITVIRNPSNYEGKAIISKIGKTLSERSLSGKRMLNVLLESDLKTGEMVISGEESFLINISRKEVIQGIPVSIIAHGLICNMTISSSKKTIVYDDYGNPVDEEVEAVLNDVPCYAEQVNAKMRELDIGLLDSTVLKVSCQFHEGLSKGDKAVVGGREYRIDDIDLIQIPRMMILQLGVWSAG